MRRTPNNKPDDNWTPEEQLENEALLKEEWWKNIETDRLPYAPRPKGGKRIDFFGYANLQDMALEIKESTHIFKHTGDVHRNAHYIGMYLMRQKHCKNRKKEDIDTFIEAAEIEMKRGVERERMLERFKSCYDQLVNSHILQDEFVSAWNKMKDSIVDDDTKKWFDSISSSILNDEAELLKSNNRLRMQKVRAALAGIRVVNE